jgi:hypothetical protein
LFRHGTLDFKKILEPATTDLHVLIMVEH